MSKGNYECRILDKAVKKEIAALIKDLPKMHSKTTTEIREFYGRTLIDAGKKQKDGSPYEPNKKYLLRVAKVTDHQKEAERNFIEGGIDRVKQYCDQIRGVNTEHTEKQEIISMLKGAFPERTPRLTKK